VTHRGGFQGGGNCLRGKNGQIDAMCGSKMARVVCKFTSLLVFNDSRSDFARESGHLLLRNMAYWAVVTSKAIFPHENNRVPNSGRR